MKHKVLLVFALCAFVATPIFAQSQPTIPVNCATGQSLNRTLSSLPRQIPVTIVVQGTCTEYVVINGLEGLTLKGMPGAALQQPATFPSNGLLVSVLSIGASRSITVDGLAIHSAAPAFGAIGIGQNSIDVRLRNLTVDGAATFGIAVYEASQASLAGVTVRDPGFATFAAFDVSDVHIEQSLFEVTTGSGYHWGFLVGSGHVTMQSTTIRNMQIGMNIGSHGSVDIGSFATYFPVTRPNDVVIDNPDGTNFQGVSVGAGSALNIGDTKLRITNAGQPSGFSSGAISVSDGSTVSDPNGNLVITGSIGQGLFVSNNSHASLGSSSITGGKHGGLVVTNLSSVAALFGSQALFGGNATDVFCDSTSVITGTSRFAGVPSTNCPNLLPYDFVPVP